MWFPEARKVLSAVEAVRQISGLLDHRKPISVDVFRNREWVLTTVGDLLMLHFDLESPPTRVKFLRFITIALHDLQCYHLTFTSSDMGSSFQDGKWLQFISCLLPHLHAKKRDTFSKNIYNDVSAQQVAYANIQQRVNEKEIQLSSGKADHEEFNRIKLTHALQKNEVEELRSHLLRLNSRADESIAKHTAVANQADELSSRMDTLKKEHQQMCDGLQRDFTSIPEEIARSKAMGGSIEAEMGQLYDTTRQLLERRGALQCSHALTCDQVPPLLDSACQLSEVYPRLDDVVKTKTNEAEALMEQESALTKQVERLQDQLASRKKEAMRERFVWCKKKQTLEAEQLERDTQTSAFELEISLLQQRKTELLADLATINESKEIERKAIKLISQELHIFGEIGQQMKDYMITIH